MARKFKTWFITGVKKKKYGGDGRRQSMGAIQGYKKSKAKNEIVRHFGAFKSIKLKSNR
jgi:hypothetical protein